MSGSCGAEKHKHCKPNCTSHNSFAVSLRKYGSSSLLNTKSSSNKSQERQSRQKMNQSYIRAFKLVPETIQKQKQNIPGIQSTEIFNKAQKQQIEQHFLKISLINKKTVKPISTFKQQTKNTMQSKVSIPTNEQKHSYEVRNSQNCTQQNQQKVVVKKNQFDQLQLNVDKISKIIDLFNKKIQGNQTYYQSLTNKYLPKSIQYDTQQMKNKEDTQINVNNLKNKVQNKIDQFEDTYSLQRLEIKRPHEKSYNVFTPSFSQSDRNPQHNSSIQKQNLEDISHDNSRELKINSRKLNYKMYNWNTKPILFSSLNGSRRKKTKCHGDLAI